jgi:hypothetical protein
MAERVSTGGSQDFIYPKGHAPQLKKEQKIEIKEAYAAADERKRKAKVKRNIIITIIIIITILSLATFYFK